MDIKEETAAREGHRRIIGKRLLTENIQDLLSEYPELIFDYKKLKANIQEYKNDIAIKEKPTHLPNIPNPWGNPFDIIDAKRRNYWIWSKNPDRAKTTWLKTIAKATTVSWYNYTEDF